MLRIISLNLNGIGCAIDEFLLSLFDIDMQNISSFCPQGRLFGRLLGGF
jgi:hypothetical protein